jgi:hypothetical protein
MARRSKWTEGGAEGCALNEIFNRLKAQTRVSGSLSELPNQGTALPGHYPFPIFSQPRFTHFLPILPVTRRISVHPNGYYTGKAHLGSCHLR